MKWSGLIFQETIKQFIILDNEKISGRWKSTEVLKALTKCLEYEVRKHKREFSNEMKKKKMERNYRWCAE